MSGHVAALGPGVTTLRVGQPVFIAGYEIANRGGLYADMPRCRRRPRGPCPRVSTPDEATALTNYQLAGSSCITPPEAYAKTVVVYGAAGGVGTALIDVARLAGASVIGTAGWRKMRLREIARRGHAIDYSKENVVERVLALTDGRGADIVFDHVAGKAFTDGLKMAAPLGMIVSYAVLGGMPETDLFKEMRGNIEHSPRCAASPCTPTTTWRSRGAKRWPRWN